MPGAYLYGWNKNFDDWGKGYKHLMSVAVEPGTQVAIGIGSTDILAANPSRTSFAMIVRGTENVFIKLGTPADNTCVELKPDDVLECDDYYGVVTGIAAAVGSKVHVFEV